MYTIYVYDGEHWQHVLDSDDRYTVESATLSESVNAAPVLTFKVYEGHPSLSYLLAAIESPLPTTAQPTIMARRDGSTVFEGRIYQHALDDLTGAHEFACEGMLARLNDYTVTPYSYSGTVSGYLDMLLTECEGALAVGNVTVSDPNNYIVRSSEQPVMLWDEIADKCIGSPLGGFLEMRNGYIVDWLAQPSASTATQDMEAGINLTGLNITVQPREMYSGVLAYGAEVGVTNSKGVPYYWNLSQASAYDVPVPSGYTLSGMTLFKDSLVSQIGQRVCIVHYESITQVSNLMNRAVSFLNAQSTTPTIQVGAVDLADAGYNADAIECGAVVQITGATFDDSMMCTAISRDLLDPASTTFEFGSPDNISSGGSSSSTGGNSATSSQYFWHTPDPVYTDAVLSGVSTDPLEDIISDIGSNARIASGAFYIRHYEQSDSSLAMLHAKNIGVQTTGGGTANIADHNISLTAAHQGNSYTANPEVQLYGGSTVNYAQLSAYDPRLLAIDGANRARMHLLANGSIGVETSTDYGATWGTMLYFGIPLSTAITNISDVLTQTSTQATNWPITAVRYQTWGKVAALSIQVTPTAAKSENYTNWAGALVSGKRPAVQAGGAGTYTRGGITTGGNIALCAAQAMAANTAYTISFTYLLA